MDNILHAKISANPKDKTWSQLYSTLNLYVLISISEYDGEEPISTFGKRLLEKLQREYFAQDEKNLSAIKIAVQNATEDLLDKKISVIVSSLVNDTLYIVITNEGEVLLKRNGAFGKIARGQNGQILGFSGKVSVNDLIILESQSFSSKVSMDFLKESLKNSASETAESLMPLVHEGSEGSEAAIILQIVNLPQHLQNIPQKDYKNEQKTIEEKKSLQDEVYTLPKKRINFNWQSIFENFNFKKIKKSKKLLFILLISILCIILTVSLWNEKQKSEEKKLQTQLEKIISPVNKKLEDALSLKTLNKGLAQENLIEAKNELISKMNIFKDSSTQKQQIDNILKKIDAELLNLKDSIKVKNKKIVLPSEKIDSIGKIISLTNKGGQLMLLTDSGKTAEVKDSKLTLHKNEFKNPKFIISDQNNYFVITDSEIIKVSQDGQNTKSLVKINTEGAIATDTFSSNIYILNALDDKIEKFSDPSYQKNSYLEGMTKLPQDPISMTIDGSVWITTKQGRIVKFRKGFEEKFTISASSANLSEDTEIYTESESTNLYILDKKTQSIIVLSKSGEYKNQYELADIGSINLFVSNEKENKIYVVDKTNTLYSFEM